jgi:ribonuclease HI
MAESKYYVVWEGRKKGIFTSWPVCRQQVMGYSGARYKSFKTKDEADSAFKAGNEVFGKQYKIPGIDTLEKERSNIMGDKEPVLESIAVDGACSVNPGRMEYRGVETKTMTCPQIMYHI